MPKGQAHTIKELTPDHENANKGTSRGLGLIETSIRRRGFGRPLFATASGQIIGGNKTLEAAVNAGLVKVRYVDSVGGEVIVHRRLDIPDIDTAEARELALADNFIHDASFDPDAAVVKRHAEAYDIDIENVGLSEQEMKDLLKRAVHEDEKQQQRDARREDQTGSGQGVLVVCPDFDAQQAVHADLEQRYGRGDGKPGYEVRIVKTTPAPAAAS